MAKIIFKRRFVSMQNEDRAKRRNKATDANEESRMLLLPGWEELISRNEYHFMKWYDVIMKPLTSIYPDVFTKIITQLHKKSIIRPDICDLWSFLNLSDLDNLKVVILGQDPYYTPNVADGMAFSSKQKNYKPPSLRNIFAAIKSQTGLNCFDRIDGYHLANWAKQGILLMNSESLTVGKEAMSHKDVGWEQFTCLLLKSVACYYQYVLKRPLFFMIWGNRAKKFIRIKLSVEAQKLYEDFIMKVYFKIDENSFYETGGDRRRWVLDPSFHSIHESVHPSPLANTKVNRPQFVNNDHFKEYMAFSRKRNIKPIDWSL